MLSFLLGTCRASPKRAFSSMSSDPWQKVGGGAVNEKERTHRVSEGESASSFDPSLHKAHLFHALEGLDRYPNYLSRWNVADMERLEASLEGQLQKVREQKQTVLDRRKGIEQLVNMIASRDESIRQLLRCPESWEQVKELLHPDAVKAIFSSRGFPVNDATPADVLDGTVKVDLDVAQLETLLDEELYDVYAFPLLSPSFCQRVRSTLQTIAATANRTEAYQHLQLGRRPIDFDTIGLGWLNDLLFHLILRPISRHLFESRESLGDLDWRQGYMAAYAARPTESEPRQRLVTHTDDSEVTLNIGMGEGDYKGGELEFRDLRGTPGEGELLGSIRPREGVALIHAGRHFHDVSAVTEGNRYNYIMWARSWQGVRKVTCACCWLNRRQGNDCVCGKRWN